MYEQEKRRLKLMNEKNKDSRVTALAIILLFTLKVLYVFGEYLPILSYQ